MAHPKVEAATLIQQFFVTNPIIMIKMIDIRNRMRNKFDQEWLPALKEFQIVQPVPRKVSGESLSAGNETTAA